MLDKQIDILKLLAKKPMRFASLLSAVNEQYVMTPDGLESQLQLMTKERTVIVDDEVWKFNKWPEGVTV